MPLVLLGNRNPLDRGQPLPGPAITSVDIGGDTPPGVVVNAIASADGLWRRHSADPRPAWVESPDSDLSAHLGTYLGCPVGRPSDWEN